MAEKLSAWVPLTREMLIDLGLATPEMIEQDRLERERNAAGWRAVPWYIKARRRLHALDWEARYRVAHASRALRGLKCEDDD
jgi:hypothetical protein